MTGCRAALAPIIRLGLRRAEDDWCPEAIAGYANERGRQEGGLQLNNSGLAVLILLAIAVVVAGLTVENYWDCQLIRHYAAKDCLPLATGLRRVRIFGPRPRDDWKPPVN
jgi:hypothetical protein